jgi:hypothetical protein
MQTNPKLIQYVDTPFLANYSAGGEARVLIISVDGYTKACVEVNGTPNTKSFTVFMGKLSGTTLGDRVATDQAADAHIHTYPIVGPEMSLFLKGPPNTSDKVLLWIYLIP